ncbi:MAG: sigma-70 family RNA polymerase sigma factor [Archangiaceae bacterium]|nr:sigma-70 family RNA polymerase sigma factor [Archangiaceae bacterium]
MSLAAARPLERSLTFEELYESQKERVYRWALQFGAGSRGWAEDVTHDVFIRVFQTYDSLHHRDDLGGLLYRVTANVALNRLRKERGIFSRLRQLLGDEVEADPHEQLALKETSREALRQLEALPALERAVLSMKLFDGKRQSEIAQTLSLSEGYVSKLLQRAMGRIRSAGWEVSDGSE